MLDVIDGQMDTFFFFFQLISVFVSLLYKMCTFRQLARGHVFSILLFFLFPLVFVKKRSILDCRRLVASAFGASSPLFSCWKPAAAAVCSFSIQDTPSQYKESLARFGNQLSCPAERARVQVSKIGPSFGRVYCPSSILGRAIPIRHQQQPGATEEEKKRTAAIRLAFPFQLESVKRKGVQ